MRFPKHVAVMAVLSANLVVASPVCASDEMATHEERIHALEETVSELKALLEQQDCGSAATCSRVEDVEKAVVRPQPRASTFENTRRRVRESGRDSKRLQ